MLTGICAHPLRSCALATAALLVGALLGALAAQDAGARNLPAVKSARPGATTLGLPANPALWGSRDLLRETGRGTSGVQPAEGPSLIRLGAGYTLDPARGNPDAALPADLRATPPAPDERGYFLVQFKGPITEQDRSAIAAAGGQIVNYVPDYAFLVSLTGAESATLASSPRVAWSGLYQPAYKLSLMPRTREPGRRDYEVLLFPQESPTAAATAIASAGGKVQEISDNGINKLLRVTLDAADLNGIARISAVAWIEPHQIPKAFNDQAQWVVQDWTPNSRHLWDMGLKGDGQTVNTIDTGIRVTHYQFFDPNVPLVGYGDFPTHRKIIAYKKAATTINIGWGDEQINTYHGTHTAGTICGDDAPNGNDPHDGMAIHAKMYFLDAGGYPNPGIYLPQDLNDDFIQPYTGNAGGAARISSNSWGNDVYGVYDLFSMQSDQFMWNHPDFLICYANGNDGSPGSVISPATAKNVVSAGGVGDGTSANTLATFESRGPTLDGRMKPTICAPAILYSAYGGNDTGYWQLMGTSMATPCLAGATALIRQYFTDGWYPTGTRNLANGMPSPSAALLKAMAINSADPDVQGYTVPDNNIGWGRIDDEQACYFSGDSRRLAVIDNPTGLLTGEYVEYQVYVASSTIPLKATLVWTDYPGNPANAVQLVNDLNFTATNGATSFKGNVFSGGQSVTGGSYDHLNVEECVRLNTPATGLWTFRIDGANIPAGPQKFALVVTGGLGSDAGIVSLDKPTYSGTDHVGIRVVDTNAGPSVSVNLSSPTEPGGETLSLSGIGGVYSGTLPLTLGPAQNGDGALSVSDGDVITATYVDANPPATLVATAAVNISGPAISDVHALAINETDVTLGWTSTAPSNSKVYYGTSPSLGSETTVTSIFSNSHTLQITGLSPNTLYYYDVESYDAQGNGVRDDNGGNHYTVSTDPSRDILLVIGNNSFPHLQSYLNAFSHLGWTYTIWQGDQSATPYVGNLSAGMASYKTVVWNTGFEQYPMFTDAARDSIAKLDSLGSRLAVFSHDVAWDFSDPTSPDYTPDRLAWFNNELKSVWRVDPTSLNTIYGLSGDPISGAYTGGIPYTMFRAGGAGDEVSGLTNGGTFSYVWRDDFTPDNIAVRWTSSSNTGDATKAVWGGTPRQVSGNYFEWSQMNVGNPDDPTRADVLNKTLLWLIGHNHPSALVTAPNGGENLTGNSAAISWTESADTGYHIASRRIYYSNNGGDTWTLITANAGPSPYNWDISSIPNGAQYKVRVALSDNASPALSAADVSDAVFSVNRPGGDTRGPAVLAGSIAASPDPILIPNPATLSATVSDVYTGNTNIAAAEWSIGSSPAPAGSGTAMTGSFNAPQVVVSAALNTAGLPPGMNTFWVRGMDAAGNWGNAGSFSALVNANPTGVPGLAVPARFALYANLPNPFSPRTEIRFDVPRASRVDLAVFDIGGRRVRTLVEGTVSAGARSLLWDGRDNRGHAVESGIYFYRLDTASFHAVRKMILLK